MRRTIFLSDGLGSEMLLHSNWIIGASFDSATGSDIDLVARRFFIRAIIRHNHALHTLHAPHTRNDPASRHIFPRIDLMPSKSRELQERAPSIRQGGDSTGQVSLGTPKALITYSRGSILPLAICFSLAFAGPPPSIFVCSSCIRAMTSPICRALSWYWVEDLSTFVGRIERAVA